MNRLTAFLTAFAALVLMAGPSFAGDVDHGSWDEYTAMTNSTVNTVHQLAGTNEIIGNKAGTKTVAIVNYEAGEINYVTVGTTSNIEGAKGVVEEHYGVAPAWNVGAGTKDYELTPAMDLFLN